ncbi:MAG: 5'-3' exonuclease [Lentisphaerae bacterium]|nr:5'-3' exonuclease [Lentisphaerota bacterium]
MLDESTPKPRLLLVDALALIYRAFHAIPDLRNAAGLPTNALFGFVKTVAQLEQIWRPTHGLVVFDGGIPQVRRELLQEYKAQRPPMPDAMRSQLPLIQIYLSHTGFKSVRQVEQEADDILATMAARAESVGWEVLVATADKDLMQIVTERVSLVIPGKADRRIGPDEVLLKTGVLPGQIVDWLALVGDNADNIPGVPGVGPKTAARWLKAWQDLPGIWQNTGSLQPERCRLSLLENRHVVERNRLLMYLERNLPGLCALEECRRQSPDVTGLLKFYREHNMQALARALSEPELF